MAIREMLTASPVSLGDVLSNGKRYVVPMFQRDYAWAADEWDALWGDLVATAEVGEGAHHFLGALVLQPAPELGALRIIDGQQRLVTLSLLALAVIVRIERLGGTEAERADNRERARLLRERFVSTKDSVSLQHRSRLKLNDSDDAFYRTYLVQGQEPPRPKGLKGSERRLYECFAYFSQRVGEHLGAAADGATLATFLEQEVAQRLRFIEIQVEKDETAFSVFETLNARGVALGTSDLLKNYLFATAARGGASDLEQARLSWTQVLRAVRQEEVASLLFQRLAGEVRDIKERRVFVELKRLVPAKRTVFEFLRTLESSAQLYAALDDPNDDLWHHYAPDARRWVRVLSALRAEQYKSIVLMAFDSLSDRPDRLARLFEHLATIAVRSTITRVNTGDVQRAYHDVAYRVGRAELKSPAAIARALSSVTPSDDEFRSAFETLAIDPRGPRKRFLRYLLSELEADASGRPIDLDAADATIEHILPEHRGAGWEAFGHEDHQMDVTRLGNLTPLESAINRDLGSAAFERKRAAYARSGYALTRAIDVAEWTPTALRARQAGLAERAVAIWRRPADE